MWLVLFFFYKYFWCELGFVDIMYFLDWCCEFDEYFVWVGIFFDKRSKYELFWESYLMNSFWIEIVKVLLIW